MDVLEHNGRNWCRDSLGMDPAFLSAIKETTHTLKLRETKA